MMFIDLNALLQSAYMAFSNKQTQQSLFLINYAAKLSKNYQYLSNTPLDAAICLEQGFVRNENEDCVLALHGLLPETDKVFGLFLICDGMGGHAHGQEAACLAIRTIVESVLPLLINGYNPSTNWRSLLIQGIEKANCAIYLRNQETSRAMQSCPFSNTKKIIKSFMGTTVTAVLLVDTTAFVANVGDSRTYLYTPERGLTKITRDHSIVATLLAQKVITEEEIYSHPQRHQITRCLGHTFSIKVDSFVINLPHNAVLLLCSDGLWEMTRNQKIAAVLQLTETNSEQMARQLLRLATEGGALDNISLIVVRPDGHRLRNNISNQTMWNRPDLVSTRPISTSRW
jgi:serine/threonine protein phosphatase PrpC